MGKRGCQVHLQKAKMKTDLWERTGWKRQASSRWAPKWHQVDAETKSLSGPEGAWGISLFIFTYFEITFHIRMLALRTCCGDVFGPYGLYIILYYIYIYACVLWFVYLFFVVEKKTQLFSELESMKRCWTTRGLPDLRPSWFWWERNGHIMRYPWVKVGWVDSCRLLVLVSVNGGIY